MKRQVKLAIIGAGTAGISAYKEATKYTKDVVLIDHGPLGTTCARVGCMPSKLLLHVANQFHARRYFDQIGIIGSQRLKVNIPQVLTHVRKLRDEFTQGVIEFIDALGEHFVSGCAEFLDPHTLQVGKKKIRADKIIIATGSNSFIPDAWSEFKSELLTSETLFEQSNLASNLAVIGGGIIGLELGQALARLGIKVSLYHAHTLLGGLTDPLVNRMAVDLLRQAFPLFLNEHVTLSFNHAKFRLGTRAGQKTTDSVLAAVGRKPNLSHLGLEKLDLELDEHHIPKFNQTTMQVENSHIYIAGDVNKTRPLLHEAADEGRIAAFNAVHVEAKNQCVVRRVPLRIVFSQPNIVVVGSPFRCLQEQQFVVGEVNYADQGRAKIEQLNQGMLRIYGERKSGRLLGAEGIVPAGEHLAHLLAWAIQKEMTASEVLQLPFYHPVLEEGLRTALRDMTNKTETHSTPMELALCDSEAVHPLS